MRQVAKSALRQLVRRMPWGARRAVIDEITSTPSLAWDLLTELAAKNNIEGFQVRGQNGLLLGSRRDAAIVRVYAQNGAWAKRSTRLIEALFRGRGGLYVDVGANIGATVVPVSRNPDVRCIALEPEPRNFRHLQLNILANCQFGNVEARQLAAFSSRSRLRFELSPDNMGDHRVRTSDGAGAFGEAGWDVIEVEALPLDELVPSNDGMLAVKIDTQGAEPHVVAGGRDTLLRADLVIMEFAPYWMSRMDSDSGTMLNFLRSHFDEMAIAVGEEGEIGRPRPIAEACDLLAQLPADKHSYVDLVFGRNAARLLMDQALVAR